MNYQAKLLGSMSNPLLFFSPSTGEPEPEAFLTPESTSDSDLSTGDVFTRSEPLIKNPHYQYSGKTCRFTKR